SKGAARSRKMYSTAPVVIRLISAARAVFAAIAVLRQLAATVTTTDHGRMASSLLWFGIANAAASAAFRYSPFVFRLFRAFSSRAPCLSAGTPRALRQKR